MLLLDHPEVKFPGFIEIIPQFYELKYNAVQLTTELVDQIGYLYWLTLCMYAYMYLSQVSTIEFFR